MPLPGFTIIFTIVLLLPMSILHSSPSLDRAAVPKVEAGKLDLSGWDFHRHGTVRLEGNWEFDSRKLVLPQASLGVLPSGQSNRYIKVPGVWNEFRDNLGRLGPKAVGTYRLRLLLPPGENFALRVPQQATAYLLFINGEAVLSNGTVSSNLEQSKPQFLPLVAEFHSKATNDLLFWIANPVDSKGGMWIAPYVGHSYQIRKSREEAIAVDLLTFGVLLIMALYHLGLWVLRPEGNSPLYFGIFCLLTGVRLLVNGEMFLLQLFPNMPWEWNVKLDYLSVPSSAAFMLFAHSLYRKLSFRPFIYSLCAIFALFTLMVLILPSQVYGIIQMPYLVLTAIGAAYVLGMLAVMAYRKDVEAFLILAGFLLLFLTVLNDILFALRIFTVFGNITPFGLILFIFFQSFVLSMRSAKAYRTAESLTIDLEKEVKERTAELEVERNRLSQQNQLIMEELQMARQIQDRLVPKSAPLDSIAYWYQPMLQVGGDFFDFIRLRDGRLGIFISDVSGHGVAAALVTSMIKSYTLQFLPEIDNPAEVLLLLNDFLCEMAAGQFVTAFYIIYDPKTQQMIWASAGHNIPYLVTSSGFWPLEVERRGYPLAIMKNRELELTEKAYFNETAELPAGAKLLLYTDGLLEAVNLTEKEIVGETRRILDFEESALSRVLERCGGMDSCNLVPEIVKSLIAFRGSRDFDDDVCIIAIDSGSSCKEVKIT